MAAISSAPSNGAASSANGSNFFSSGLRQKVDQLMDILWAGGVNNPMDSIEQISYLLFLPLQKEFARRVKETREIETAQAASRRRTEDLFQSMLHKAFNGEL